MGSGFLCFPETETFSESVAALGNDLPKNIRPLGFLALVWTALMADAVFLSILRNGASFDGAEQLLYTQYWAFGYGRSQPPLYTWLLQVFHQVFGVSLLAENILKFSLAGVAFTAIHNAALLLWQTRAAGRIAVILCLLVPEVVWEMQRNYSHSILLMALVALMYLAYVALLHRPTIWRYALFGTLLGMMFLAKYNSVLIIIALVVADLLILKREGAFYRKEFLLAAGLAVLVVSPHLIWAFFHVDHVIALTKSFEIGASDGVLNSWLDGSLAYLGALAALGSLAGVVTTVVGGGSDVFRPIALKRFTTFDVRSVVLLSAVVFLGLSLVLTLAMTTTNIRPRWLLPAVVPLAIWAGGKLHLKAPWAMTGWYRAGMAVAVIACLGMVAEEFRPAARTAFDYDKITFALQRTLNLDAAIFVEYQYFANLRLYMAELLLASPAMPLVPDLSETAHPVALWFGEETSGTGILQYAFSLGLSPVPGSLPVAFMLDRGFGSSKQVFAQVLEFHDQ